MFQNFIKKAREAEPQQEVKKDVLIEHPLLNNEFFNPNLLKEKLINFNKFNDNELYNIILKNYKTILSGIFDGNKLNDNFKYTDLLKNARFMSIFIQCISSLECVSHEDRVRCNKIAYDYMTSNSKDKNQQQIQLMLSLSRVVNRDILPGLLGLSIPNSLAEYLALCRYSSAKEMINIRRLNLVIESADINLMTEQMIVWIYEKLFDRITPLFIGVMFDADTSDLSENQLEIFGRISLAILDIVANMPSNYIESVLTAYADDYYMLYKSKTGYRFSLHSISSDYIRITNVIDKLEQENIYIP